MYAMPGHKFWESAERGFPRSSWKSSIACGRTPAFTTCNKFRLNTRAHETRMANIAIAPLVTRNFSVIGRLIMWMTLPSALIWSRS